MNAILNIHRLGLLIRKELIEKYKILLIFLAIAVLIYLMAWSFCIILGIDSSADTRAIWTVSLLSFCCYLIPYIAYKNENRRIEGVFYGIAPVSALEKFISMLVLCMLLFPAVVTVLILSVDSLLTLLPLEHGYNGQMWPLIFSSESFISSIIHINLEISAEEATYIERIFDSISPLSLTPYTNMLLGQTLFIFLATLFRRHKIGFTLLTYCGVSFLISIAVIVTAILLINSIDKAGGITEEIFLRWTADAFKITSLVGTYIAPVIFLALSYLRIKKIQY
ncbi:MAG TPA: hypothetical protein IAC03_00270 [Candidatus Coprenecus pullistercoris]|nr:hypothetical protein [Candidatus Coprenecus pullistercoris]